MKLIDVVGARPQFIKVAPILWAIDRYNLEHSNHPIEEVLIHTGQHYDYELSQAFFVDLDLPKPDYNLDVGSGSHGVQTGEMLKRIENVLLKEKPDLVMVYGDTNSTLAGALAAAKLHIPVAHVEAGLRSFNKRMPEEVNRVLTDHISDLLFCPTETAVKNLQHEGFTNILNDSHLIPYPFTPYPLSLNPPLVVNVGDVMYDSVLHNIKLAEKHSDILERLHLVSNELHQSSDSSLPHNPYPVNPSANGPNEPVSYALATVHRAENTDDPERLRSIFQAFTKIVEMGLPVIVPLHPRTRNALSFLPLTPYSLPPSFIIIDPVPYKDMLVLEKNARIILTDSGGVQKEAYWFRVPCVTLREETEWVETVEAGWNTVVGWETNRIIKAVNEAKPGSDRGDFYGDGRAAERIILGLYHMIGRDADLS